MKFKIISLGCPKNLVESEYIAHRLEQAGHTLSETCDTVIINTCAFIADAARESIETILQEAADKDGKGRRIVVAGCLVERYREKLPELLPEVDLFAGRGFYPEIGRIISETGFFLNETGFKDTYPRKVLTSPPSAYLKIQEGCNNRCTYCTVPDIRGPLRSRPSEDIVEEFRYLLGQGFKEINVIGQDITSFGRDSGSSLKVLLRLLLNVQGDYFLRLLYLHPRGIDDELIDIIGHENHVVPYLDIPIQHSEDRILRLMGRGYTKDDLKSLLGRIRNSVPDITLRTTVIVGFPGESDEEFSGLCDFIKTWEFDMLGAFTYSREEGTPAYKLKGHVKKPVKQARYNTIMAIQKDVSKRRLKRLEGRTVRVIIEGQDRPYMAGRLLTQAPDIDGIAFVKGACTIGEIREGKIVKTLDYDVIVEVQ
ncbi:MAG: Ribosomal protein S12 methylthiotransferase RimO [Syntrophorhabdus sp. PtaU1.Bin002]|nr:MAG: Ribosomal protein S12 methylthiotransferase RimO [Syntrophorhabdus sp. PtaU1.Bin002]